MAPSRHDWKIVDWDVKPQHNQPIKVKFHMEPPWDGGMKVCLNSPGYMTKMAAMPVYGKNLKKS